MGCFVRILFLFSVLTSCQSTSHKQVYIDLANQEMNSFARMVKQSDGLILFGSGGAFYDGIENVSFSFMSPESPSIEEARFQYYNLCTSLKSYGSTAWPAP